MMSRSWVGTALLVLIQFAAACDLCRGPGDLPPAACAAPDAGGLLDGGALDGGALDGGALDGGALDGGALDGGDGRDGGSERPASLKVLSIQTTPRGPQLGVNSINPGCPIEVTALLTNTGNAAISTLQATLWITSDGEQTSALSWEPRPLPALSLAGGASAEVAFRVGATSAVRSGQPFEIRLVAAGIAVDSGLAVETEPGASPPLRVIASRARVQVTGVVAEQPSAVLGESVRLRATTSYDYDAANAGNSLVGVRAALRFSVGNDSWVAASDNAPALPMCGPASTPPAACAYATNTVTTNVPTTLREPGGAALPMPTGPVAVSAVVFALDPSAGSGVTVCGFSNPGDDATIDVRP